MKQALDRLGSQFGPSRSDGVGTFVNLRCRSFSRWSMIALLGDALATLRAPPVVWAETPHFHARLRGRSMPNMSSRSGPWRISLRSKPEGIVTLERFDPSTLSLAVHIPYARPRLPGEIADYAQIGSCLHGRNG